MPAAIMDAVAANVGQSAFMAGGVARLTLSAIFAGSALDALRDRDLHAAVVAQYRLLPAWLVSPAALALPLLSLAAALLLLPAAAAWLGAGLGFGLLLVFTLAIGVNLARGLRDIDCGCGGAVGQRLSGGLLLRNLALIALSLVALWAPSRGVVEPASVTGIVGGGAALVAMYFAANQLFVNGQRLKDLDAPRRAGPWRGVS
jgi:hypothetical protein